MNNLDAYVHIGSMIVTGIVGAIVFYVGYRMLLMKEWFRAEMRAAIKENCADKIKFEAHVEADEAFQRSSRELIDEKFNNVKNQVGQLGTQVERVAQMLEQRRI